jgi:hypothetical protein
MSRILAIIAHAHPSSCCDHTASNHHPANNLRPVKAFNTGAQSNYDNTGPKNSGRTAPENRVEFVKNCLPQLKHKTGEENGCCQTDVQQLDRKPLLRIQHSFHHLIPSAILTSTFMAICISDCAVLFQL